MLIKTYETKDSNNTINKILINKLDYDIKFKSDVNINSPSIVLKSNNLIDFNYVYIPNFNKYYFVENVEIFPNNIYTITLKCDVLMSFKDDILNSNADIVSQTNYNDYYNFNYSSEVRKEVDIYKSDYIMSDETSTILVTLGG